MAQQNKHNGTATHLASNAHSWPPSVQRAWGVKAREARAGIAAMHNSSAALELEPMVHGQKKVEAVNEARLNRCRAHQQGVLADTRECRRVEAPVQRAERLQRAPDGRVPARRGPPWCPQVRSDRRREPALRGVLAIAHRSIRAPRAAREMRTVNAWSPPPLRVSRWLPGRTGTAVRTNATAYVALQAAEGQVGGSLACVGTAAAASRERLTLRMQRRPRA